MKSLHLKFMIIALIFVNIPITFAQTETNFIHISLNKDFGFRGQRFIVNYEGSFNEIRLIIINPYDMVLFNSTVLLNGSSNFPIALNAEYGKYRIIGTNKNILTETWFSVISKEDWEIVDFPYTRSFKNMNITFHKDDWSFKVDSIESSFNITLDEFKKLSQLYDFNVTARVNRDIFLIRMSHNNIVNDITFMFYHKGIKWSMNGTLDQPRQFEINIKANKIKRFRDEIRLANLRMNLKDLRKTGISFSYNNKKLIIDCEKSYYIDPIIFSSGFETGDFSEFDGINKTPIIVTSPVYSGIYAMAINEDYEYAYKENLDADTTYLSYRIHWNNTIPIGDNVIVSRSSNTGIVGTSIIMVKIRNNGGTMEWGLRWRENGGFNEAFSSLHHPFNGTYYNVQVYFKGQSNETENSLDAECGLFINNLNLTDIYKSGYDSDKDDIDAILIGLIYKPVGVTGNFTYDNVLLDNETFISHYLNMESLTLSTENARTWCTVSIDLETNDIPSHYWLEHNISGTMVNETSQSWIINGTHTYSIILPNIINYPVSIRMNGNTSYVYNSTNFYTFTTQQDVVVSNVGSILTGLLIVIAIMLFLGVRRK